MDALKYLGYDPNKELPIVAKIKSDVKKLNDKNLIISKIKDMESKLNFEYEKKRLIWSENESATKKAAAQTQQTQTTAPPPEIFEPTQFKFTMDVVTHKDEYMEKISEFLEEVNRSTKNKSAKKVKSSGSNFLSKLVLDKSDFLTSSAKSMNTMSDMPSLEDFSSIHNAKKHHHHHQEIGEFIDDDNEEINSIYYDEFIGQPQQQQLQNQKTSQNQNKQINSDHLRSTQRSNATNNTQSSLKIDTIIEES
jgi:hypothetical protein